MTVILNDFKILNYFYWIKLNQIKNNYSKNSKQLSKISLSIELDSTGKSKVK